MNVINNNQINIALKALGFSKEDVNRHSKKLSTLLDILLLNKFMDSYPDERENITKGLQSFLGQHSKDEKIIHIINETIREVSSKYFDTITQKLTQQQKEVFYSKLSDLINE